MLCSKCYKKIPQSEEIQVESSIICKECSLMVEKANKEKAIARCWNCNQFLYKGDLTHESFRDNFRSWESWFSIGSRNSEKLIQCDKCYQEWRNEEKRLENWSKIRGTFAGFFIGSLLYLTLKLFFPEANKRMLDNPSLVVPLFVLSFIIIIILGPILDANRHKFRKKPKNRKK